MSSKFLFRNINVVYRDINILLQVSSRQLTYTLVNARPVRLAYASFEAAEPSPQPPIFIFHGILGNKKFWEGIGRTILNITKRTVITVDLRNHGDSPHANSHKYVEQAKDILLLFDQLGTREASLIGYSIGGRTAMCVALMAPHKVAGLLLIEISPKSIPPQFKRELPRLLRAMKRVDLKKHTKVSIAKMEAIKEINSSLHITDEVILQTIISNIRRKPDGTIGWACNLDVIMAHYKYWMSFPTVGPEDIYDGPTLFLGGQLSEFIPPDELLHIRDLFPRSVIIYIPKTGHYIHINDPATFLRITIAFLNRHEYRQPNPILKK